MIAVANPRRPYEYMGTDSFRCHRCKSWTPIATVHSFSPHLLKQHHEEGHRGPATMACHICFAREPRSMAAVCPACFEKTERELLNDDGTKSSGH